MSKTERTILIVDDNPEDRELYRRYLRKDNKYSYRILEASLGRQGLELWQKYQPDVIFLDYRLPDLDGVEFLNRLSSFDRQAFFPAILVTGQGNETIAVEAMKAGAQDYLIKGQITPESLHLIVNKTIEKMQLRTQLQQSIERQAELYQNLQNELVERKRVEAEREKLLIREKAAREEAERANSVKDLFLAILSHELRTPLTPILGWTLLLKNYSSERVRLDQGLASIERHAKLLLKLIDDLLDVSRIWRGKITLDLAPVNLIDVVRASLETASAAADAKSIDIQTNLQPVGRVNADYTRLQQIIGNLLSNAIKFTDSGGKIEIKLTRINNSAQIIISDNGKGIDPQFLPHVFEYFLQDDGSITRKYGGLGLGLAIVRHLVDLHGGVVAVTSKGLGCGATFIVSLPLLEEKPSHNIRDRYKNLNAIEPNLKGVRILIVEDDLDHLDFLTALLSCYQAELTPLSSAKEALLVLEKFTPDLIISDIAMPEMDGLTLIKSIRSRLPEKGGKIPAIALTAHARNEDRELAIAAGFQTHLSKPLNIHSLTASILKVLQN
jgi:signal transduction histidine kinase